MSIFVKPLDALEKKIVIQSVQRFSLSYSSHEFHVVAFYFHDAAMKVFGVKIKEDEAIVTNRAKSDFRRAERGALLHATAMWNEGLVPIEIFRKNGAMFYAVPKVDYFLKTMNHTKLIYSEIEIPHVSEFY